MKKAYIYVFIKSYRNQRIQLEYFSDEIIPDIELLEDISIQTAERDGGGSIYGCEVFFDLDFYYWNPNRFTK